MPGSISVVIPTRNRPHYLRQAIESALSQGPEVAEVIVCDDASDEAPEALIASFGDARITLLRHQKQLGAAGNWISGLRATQAAMVALLADDDLWGEHFLALAVREFQTHPILDVVFCGNVIIDEHGRQHRAATQRDDALRRRDSLHPGPQSPYDFLEAAIVTNAVSLGGAVIRREPLLRVLRPEAGWALDFDIRARLALAHARASYLPYRGAVWRVHRGAATMAARFGGMEERIACIDQLIADFPQQPEWVREELLAMRAELAQSWAWYELEDGHTAHARQLLRAGTAGGYRKPVGLALSLLPPGMFRRVRRTVIGARQAAKKVGQQRFGTR